MRQSTLSLGTIQKHFNHQFLFIQKRGKKKIKDSNRIYMEYVFMCVIVYLSSYILNCTKFF